MDKKILKYLGVDWGEKRIGLSLGDSETKMATPFKVVNSVSDILSLIKKEEIDRIIVGLPVKMSGAADETSDVFNKFIKYLRDRAGIPLEFMDERLTSKAADALPGTKKTKAARDSIAAMLILQAYLDKI